MNLGTIKKDPNSSLTLAQTLEKLMVKSIESGNLIDIERCLRSGFGIDQPLIQYRNKTPALYAIENGHCESFRRLIDLGSNVKQGYTLNNLFTEACKVGDVQNVKKLVDNGFVIEPININMQMVGRACQQSNVQMASYLLKNGLNKACDNVYMSNLFFSSIENIELFDAFLESGFDVKFSYSDDSLLSHAASKTSNLAVIKHLIEKGAPLEHISDSHESPLMQAIKKGNLNVVKLLIDSGANIEAQRGWETPLRTAIFTDNVEITQYLIDLGVDTNTIGGNSGNPLVEACKRGNADIAHLLLPLTKDINCKSASGLNALMYACRTDLPSVVAQLLEMDIDSSAIDNQGVHVLTHASRTHESRCIELLLTKCGDLFPSDIIKKAIDDATKAHEPKNAAMLENFLLNRMANEQNDPLIESIQENKKARVRL